MVLKVFLKYRRSVFDVDLASQKSSKIGKNHIHIGKNRFLNRAEKTYVFLIDFFMKRAPKRHLFWLPKSVIKASKREPGLEEPPGEPPDLYFDGF